MKHPLFLTVLALALAGGPPAVACRRYTPPVLDDVRYADVVLVGRVSDYRIVRDEAVRREMLDGPGFSAGDRQRLGAQLNETTMMGDYARLEIEVDEVVVGTALERVTATWYNSTFEVPEEIGTGPFLIALRRPSSETLPLRGPSVTIFPNAEPDLLTLLQAPCSSPFVFDVTSDEAMALRRILNERRE